MITSNVNRPNAPKDLVSVADCKQLNQITNTNNSLSIKKSTVSPSSKVYMIEFWLG